MIQPTYTYRATVVRVVDGDTIDLLVDLGFHASLAIRTRLLAEDATGVTQGIDAPEVSTDAGRVARDFLREQLPVGAAAVASTYKEPGDKYGRWLAVIEDAALGDIGTMMVSTGHAVYRSF